jgi:hypothetical protein
VIEEKIVSYLEDNNILGESQGAFRKNRRLEDHVFTLQGICSLQKKKRKNTYLAFLDLSKAFDRVWREGLFYLLWQNGIQGKCWRLLWSLYKEVNNRVLFGNYESDWFSQDYGVKQGCVLSPTLFSILMNDLVSMLDKAGVGVQVSNQLINSLLFADDITWIANSEHARA